MVDASTEHGTDTLASNPYQSPTASSRAMRSPAFWENLGCLALLISFLMYQTFDPALHPLRYWTITAVCISVFLVCVIRGQRLEKAQGN